MFVAAEGNSLDLGIKVICDFMGWSFDDELNIYTLASDEPYCLKVIRKENEKACIYYKEKHHFFRALGLYFQSLSEGNVTIDLKEKSYIQNLGPMFDVSRNCVYTVKKLKELLVKLALMGYNQCMLYSEDTYTLEDYPYFGYMRGRYSPTELRELDDFAASLGIELIPCIQTLAHLKLALKWNYAENFKDTADVLLVGEEATYTLIENMFKSIKATFKSSKIHIGMDEAFDLGRGRALDQYGHKHHSELMRTHLQKVCELAKKYDLEPMLWDDMFMRGMAPTSNQYDLTTTIDQDFIDSIPPELSLVYWDYYHTDPEFYQKSFDKRKAFNNPIVFAGGIWKWMGYAPHYQKTMATLEASLSTCKKNGISQVFATMWGDDGDETPIDAIMLGLIFFSEHCYHQTVDKGLLEDRCLFLTKLHPEDFMSLEAIDLIPGVTTPNLDVLNPSKYLLYQDILSGAFDYYVEDVDLSEHYLNLSEHYYTLSKKTLEYSKLFTLYHQLSLVLSMKANIGCHIRKAYLEDDTDALHTLAHVILPELKAATLSFNQALRELWLHDAKGHGLEILDIRLSGICGRCDTAIYRINQYLNNEISSIEELDEARLPFKFSYNSKDTLPNFNQYVSIASQNAFSMSL